MSSEKVARWEGITVSHAFWVQVFCDPEQGLFSAHIEASSPALAPIVPPGQKMLMMELADPANIAGVDNFDTLKALARKHITDRFGEILQWREVAER